MRGILSSRLPGSFLLHRGRTSRQAPGHPWRPIKTLSGAAGSADSSFRTNHAVIFTLVIRIKHLPKDMSKGEPRKSFTEKGLLQTVPVCEILNSNRFDNQGMSLYLKASCSHRFTRLPRVELGRQNGTPSLTPDQRAPPSIHIRKIPQLDSV